MDRNEKIIIGTRLLVVIGGIGLFWLAASFGRSLFFVHAWSGDAERMTLVISGILCTLIVTSAFRPFLKHCGVVSALAMTVLPIYKLLLYFSTLALFEMPYENASVPILFAYVVVAFFVIAGVLRSVRNASWLVICLVIVQLPLTIQYAVFLNYS